MSKKKKNKNKLKDHLLTNDLPKKKKEKDLTFEELDKLSPPLIKGLHGTDYYDIGYNIYENVKGHKRKTIDDIVGGDPVPEDQIKPMTDDEVDEFFNSDIYEDDDEEEDEDDDTEIVSLGELTGSIPKSSNKKHKKKKKKKNKQYDEDEEELYDDDEDDECSGFLDRVKASAEQLLREIYPNQKLPNITYDDNGTLVIGYERDENGNLVPDDTPALYDNNSVNDVTEKFINNDPEFFNKTLDLTNPNDVFNQSVMRAGLNVDMPDSDCDTGNLDKLKKKLGKKDFNKLMNKLANEPYDEKEACFTDKDILKKKKKLYKKYNFTPEEAEYYEDVLTVKAECYGLDINQIDLSMFDNVDHIDPTKEYTDEELFALEYKEDKDPDFKKRNLKVTLDYSLEENEKELKRMIKFNKYLLDCYNNEEEPNLELYKDFSIPRWYSKLLDKNKEYSTDPDKNKYIETPEEACEKEIERQKELYKNGSLDIKGQYERELDMIDQNIRLKKEYDKKKITSSVNDFAWKKTNKEFSNIKVYTKEECGEDSYNFKWVKPDLERIKKKEKKLLRKKYGVSKKDLKALDGDRVYFKAKKLKYLNPVEQYLCKNFPDKYYYGYPPSHDMKTVKPKKLSAREEYWLSLETPEERQLYDEQEEFFDYLEDKEKHPKKYKKNRQGLTKAERYLNKYFREIDSKGRKLNKHGKVTEDSYMQWLKEHLSGKQGKKVLKMIKKENKIAEENFGIYFDIKQVQKDFNDLVVNDKSNSERKMKRVFSDDNANRNFNRYLSCIYDNDDEYDDDCDEELNRKIKNKLYVESLEDQMTKALFSDPLVVAGKGIDSLLREQMEKSKNKKEKHKKEKHEESSKMLSKKEEKKLFKKMLKEKKKCNKKGKKATKKAIKETNRTGKVNKLDLMVRAGIDIDEYEKAINKKAKKKLKKQFKKLREEGYADS